MLSSEPLATLAGVYQDVRGQKPEELWREAVSLWAGWLLEVIPDLLGNAQLRPLAQASIGAFSVVLEAVLTPETHELSVPHWAYLCTEKVFWLLISKTRVLIYDLDRSAYVPLAGEQTGAGSVWSSETTGFCLQTLPQVLACFKTLSFSPWNLIKSSDKGQFCHCNLMNAVEFLWKFSAFFFFFLDCCFTCGVMGSSGTLLKGTSSSATTAPSQLMLSKESRWMVGVKYFLMFLVPASVLQSYRCHFRPCPGPRGARLDWQRSFWRSGSWGPCSLWPPFALWPNSTASKERWWTARSDVRLSLCFMRCDSEKGFIQVTPLSDRPSSSGGRSVCGDLWRSPPWAPGLLRPAARPGRQRRLVIHAAA